MKIGIKSVVLLVLILVSLWFIASPYILTPSGAVVSVIANASNCNLKLGDVINRVGPSYVTSKADFENLIQAVKKGDRVTMVVNSGPGGCTAVGEGDIGIEVKDMPKAGLRFGIDIAGGDKVVFDLGGRTGSAIEKVASAMRSRVSSIGIPSTTVSTEGNSVVIETPDSDYVKDIGVQGEIVAAIQWGAKISNMTGEVRIGKDSYKFSTNGKEVSINGMGGVPQGQEIQLGQYEVTITNITNSSMLVEAFVFDNKDVSAVRKTLEYTKYDPQSMAYYFYIPVELTSAGSSRFSSITNGLPVISYQGQSLLDGALLFYLDGKELSRLTIPADMSGVNITSMSVIGMVIGEKEAVREKALVTMSLEGGIIEGGVAISSVEKFDGQMGWALPLFTICIIAILFAFASITYIHYRQMPLIPKLSKSSYGTLVIAAEVVVIAGLAAMTTSFFSPGLVLNATTLVGGAAFCSLSALSMSIIQRKPPAGSKLQKIGRYLPFVVALVGLVMMFTPASGAGVILFAGTILSSVLTKPLYAESVSS
jgi:hypothetical protein